MGESEQAITMLFKILMEEEQPDEGSFKWGVSVTTSYMPVDNGEYFNGCELSILDWIRQYSVKDETETYLRGFLGRMLFSGDDVYKPVNVLSGGEKVRCMFSRMMLFGSNVLVLDRPTNHLDLESITAVNNSLINFKGVVLLASHDHEIMQTTANRIIEITPEGCIDRQGTYEEFIDFKKENGICMNLYNSRSPKAVPFGLFSLFKWHKLLGAFLAPLCVERGGLHQLHSLIGAVVLHRAFIALSIGINSVYLVFDDKVCEAVLCLDDLGLGFIGGSLAYIAGT